MNEIIPASKPALAAGPVRAIVPQDFEGVFRMATMIFASGMAPKDMNSPEKISVAVLHGLELGLTPMAALQSIAVVNGRPSIWGDGALGLVRGSGQMESFDEDISGDGDARTATCTVKRKGEPKPLARTFSVADARKAGLWNKSGPWTQYPDRMLRMRARSFALRDGFADILRGLAIAEEAEDVAPMRDITPPPPPPPEPPEPSFDAPEQGAPAPVAASKAAAGSAPSRSQPQQEIDRPALDVEKWLRGLEAACSKATSEAELRVVWDSQKAAYSSLGDADKKRANGIVGKRKKALAEPAEVVEPAFSLDAFLVELDETFAKATAVEALSELFAAEVDTRLEQGLVSRADVEGKIADLFQRHRDRIEDVFPGDR